MMPTLPRDFNLVTPTEDKRWRNLIRCGKATVGQSKATGEWFCTCEAAAAHRVSHDRQCYHLTRLAKVLPEIERVGTAAMFDHAMTASYLTMAGV